MATIEMRQLEKFNVMEKVFKECSFNFNLTDELFNESYEENYFTEAVFANGKKKIEPIVAAVQRIKDILEEKINDQKLSEKSNRKNIKRFNPNAFWRSGAFKELEDIIKDIFGFRSVVINPVRESYISNNDEFASKVMGAWIYTGSRYPIDGLVTDDGFYDKTHSLNVEAVVTLGLIKALTAEEIVGVLLHEFGHGIDPALVDISYIETNILSKMLTDRVEKYTPDEKAYLKNVKGSFVWTTFMKILGSILPKTVKLVLLPALFLFPLLNWLKDFISRWFLGDEEFIRRKAEKLRDFIKKNVDFDRYTYDEAFADNFARMYGFGPALVSALKKIDKCFHDQTNNAFMFQHSRENALLDIFKIIVKDEHRTGIHRAYEMIKDYKKDLNDPNIPDKVKENIKNDLQEMEILLDQYVNSFDALSNRLNAIVLEELKKADKENELKEKK